MIGIRMIKYPRASALIALIFCPLIIGVATMHINRYFWLQIVINATITTFAKLIYPVQSIYMMTCADLIAQTFVGTIPESMRNRVHGCWVCGGIGAASLWAFDSLTYAGIHNGWLNSDDVSSITDSSSTIDAVYYFVFSNNEYY